MSSSPPFHVVINAHSGGAEAHGREALTTLLHEALPGRIESLTFAEGKDIETIIRDRLNANPLPLLIGGGDGSIAAAAGITRHHGVPLGLLPLGTMNLLANDLGLGDMLPTLLPRYADAQIAMIDTGSITSDGGEARNFLCSAVIGIVPETAIKREDARRDHSLLTWAEFSGILARGLSGRTTRKLTLTCDGQTFDIDVSALVISNNAFLPPTDSAFRYRRESLTGGKLAVYGVSPAGALDGLRLLFKLWRGSWHEDETVFSFETEALTVHGAEAELLLVSIDGEPLSMSSPLQFAIAPSSLPVLLPRDAA